MTNAIESAMSKQLRVSDMACIERLALGDLAALGVLFDRHGADIRRYMIRLGVSAHDADDLVQLTFLDVARIAVRFDVRRPTVRAWIFGIATMVVRRHRRSYRRFLDEVTGGWFESLRAPPTKADEAYEHNEEHFLLERAIARLSPKRREAFVLVVMEEHSGEDAASILGIPVATLWTRLHHARRDLRAYLNEGEP